jgi:hypothetical protein
MRTTDLAGVWAVFLLSTLIASAPAAQAFDPPSTFVVLTKVVDLATPVPNSTAAFTGFVNAATDGNTVAFDGGTNDFNENGVFGWKGGDLFTAARVADTPPEFPMPEFPWYPIVLEVVNDRIAILGGHDSIGSRERDGLFYFSAGALTKIWDNFDPEIGAISSSETRFTRWGYARSTLPGAYNGNESLFWLQYGDGPSRVTGFYTDLGGLPIRKVISFNDEPPFASPWSYIYSPSMSGQNLAFAAVETTTGEGVHVFAEIEGTSLTVIQEGDPLPKTSELFRTALGVEIANKKVFFIGRGDGTTRGIYKRKPNGVIKRVVDTSQEVPEGPPGTLFTDFRNLSADRGRIAFEGISALGKAIYVTSGGKLLRVVGEGDTVDGTTVERVFLHRDGLHGTRIAFGINTVEGTAALFSFLSIHGDADAIYVADLTLGCLAVP